MRACKSWIPSKTTASKSFVTNQSIHRPPKFSKLFTWKHSSFVLTTSTQTTSGTARTKKMNLSLICSWNTKTLLVHEQSSTKLCFVNISINLKFKQNKTKREKEKKKYIYKLFDLQINTCKVVTMSSKRIFGCLYSIQWSVYSSFLRIYIFLLESWIVSLLIDSWNN